ncbi:hypothetical protein GQ600_18292 [Phytophthora cactorum]|nr:hypothetical protein GQ600_18292 [Phytophthora cactorum]
MYFAFNEMDLVVTGGCGPCDVHAGDLYYRQCFQPRGSDEQTDLSVPHLTLVGLSELNEWASRNILYGEGEEILQVVNHSNFQWLHSDRTERKLFRSLRTVSRTLQFQQQTLTYFPSTLNVDRGVE